MGARKGVKNPQLLLATRSREERVPVAYVVSGKPMKYQDQILRDGTEVPGAADWLRLEAWVAGRRLRPVYAGEVYTSFKTHMANYEFSQKVLQVAGNAPPEDETQEG